MTGGLWRAAFAAEPGVPMAWWVSGTLYAHVDGLREFPVVATRSLLVHRTRADASGPTVVDWNVYGFFGDLHGGAAATRWTNPFTGAALALPPRFREGPGRYRVRGDQLELTAAGVRTNRAVLMLQEEAEFSRLTQIEGTLQGFPGPSGPPPLDGPSVTERQNRMEFVLPRSTGARPVSGLLTQVYDDLPAWLGFGDRLGGTVIKGVMLRAAPGAPPDAAVGRTLRSLFPDVPELAS